MTLALPQVPLESRARYVGASRDELQISHVSRNINGTTGQSEKYVIMIMRNTKLEHYICFESFVFLTFVRCCWKNMPTEIFFVTTAAGNVTRMKNTNEEGVTNTRYRCSCSHYRRKSKVASSVDFDAS